MDKQCWESSSVGVRQLGTQCFTNTSSSYYYFIDCIKTNATMITDVQRALNDIICATPREKGTSDFPSYQSFSAHVRPLGKASLVLWLKFTLGLPLTRANSIGFGEEERVRRLARTCAVRICYNGSFPMMRLIYYAFFLHVTKYCTGKWSIMLTACVVLSLHGNARLV